MTYTSTRVGSVRTLKEQLRLFAFNDSQPSSVDISSRIQQGMTMRERLSALLEAELNFHGEDSGYASHDLHAFAAKFPPQLPRAFIRGLTNPGDVVLDPMMGSGTTVVEALLEGRYGVGIDIDPLALRLGFAKTMTLDVNILRNAGQRVLAKAHNLLSKNEKVEKKFSQYFSGQTRAFVEYWFLPNTQRELMALTIAIQDVTDLPTRRFLELTFSSIIVTKSGGVSRARDLAHSRPHLDESKFSKNALDQFSLKLRKNLISLAQLKTNGTVAMIIAGDARALPIGDEAIDLIVTSPPYANAIDYMRAHKFSLVWLGRSIPELSELRSKYIGSERIGHMPADSLPNRPQTIIQQLRQRDNKKASILLKYLNEMKAVLSEMYRVLRQNSPAIVVVGTSVMRGLDVQTHHCLADIAAERGFDVIKVVQRTLDRNKRMMPARFQKSRQSMIEQRMHEEYVIGLLKPEHAEDTGKRTRKFAVMRQYENRSTSQILSSKSL